MRGDSRGHVPDAHNTTRTMTINPIPATGPGWRALVPVWATVFTGMLWLSSIRPFVRVIADDLNTSVSMIGQVTTAAMLTMAMVGFGGALGGFYGGVVLQLADYQVLGIAVLPFAIIAAYLVWTKDAPAFGAARLRAATQFLR